VQSDPLRLRQIVMNLVSNAIKFTNAGEVTVGVRVDRRDDGDGHELTVAVSDTGIGMNREQVARLFQPFSQADATMTRRFGGTGLGLTISKHLVEMLGGRLVVESQEKCGSTFSFTLPAGELTASHWIHGVTETTFDTVVAERPALREAALRGRILLVEDGKDNQRLIAAHLRKAGADVVIADNGRAAIELATTAAPGFDVILMDMQMPELDGYGAACELRRLGLTSPIIALTAHAMTGDRERCLRAGCSDYLSKPVDRTQLLWTVASHIGRQGDELDQIKDEPIPPAPPPPPRSAFLCSEFADDPQMRELIEQFVCELPEVVQQIERLLDDGNIEDLRRAIHQLKGAGGGYGFTPITQLAARAEHTIKTHGSIAQVRQCVQELLEMIARVDGYSPPPIENELVESTAYASENPDHR
jgi:CheY-like chemotaxis protein/anti-sigma regulatory factor (Ser/Thr protein kinase)